MTEKIDELIIDACLDEVLGGQSPPNLTDRILRAWGQVKSQSAVESTITSRAELTGPCSTAEPTASVKVRDPVGNRRSSPWLAIAASLTIIGLGSAFVWAAWYAIAHPDQRANQIAMPETPLRPSQVTPVPESGSFTHVPPQPRRESPDPVANSAAIPSHKLAIDPAPHSQDKQPIPDVHIPDDRPAPLSDEQIVLAINQLIRNGWQSEGITPAEPVSDEQWCERVYVKLVGRVPSAAEVSSFVASPSAKRREELVDLLLHGETYVEEFASHWGRTWADILIASGDKSPNRDGLEQYLRRALGDGKPFDQTTKELLIATGSGELGTAAYNGATNFLLAHADAKGVQAQATAQVSRTFMALSLECSQCHFDGIWSGNEQRQFWELNAFFRQMRMKRVGDERQIVNMDFPGEGGTPESAEIYFELPNGLLKAALPVFVDGNKIPPNGAVADVDRRNILAQFITRSEQFRQAMANRFWAELFGVGFTIPADNIGPHNPPSHPELLAKLGGQFAAHDYDVRALIRWIVLSEPFALSTGDVATHDQIGSKLVFDRFPQSKPNRTPVLNQLRVAKEAYTSFVNKLGTSATPARVNPTITPGAVPTELADVDKVLATVDMEARRISKATVYGNYILESDMSREQKIQHIFFATLHRAPTASEQKAVEGILANGNAGADETAWEYIWWALASSQEAR